MTQTNKISAFQLYSILFLSRTIALFTLIVPSERAFDKANKIAIIIPFFICELIYGIFTFLVVKKTGTKNIITQSEEISPLLSKPVSVIYILFFLWSGAIALSNFELFLSTVLGQSSDQISLLIVVLIVSVIAASRKIEALGRASVIILVVIVLSLIGICLSTVSEFDSTNIPPFLHTGTKNIYLNAFYSSTRTVEIATIPIVADKVRGNLRKGFAIWLTLFSAMAAAIFTILTGVAGEYGNNQVFQLYTLTVIAKIGVLERFDDLIISIWCLCEFIKISYLIYLCSKVTEHGFKKKNNLIFCSAAAVIMFIISIFLSKSVFVFSKAQSGNINNTASLVMFILLPLMIFILTKIKNRKRNSTV